MQPYGTSVFSSLLNFAAYKAGRDSGLREKGHRIKWASKIQTAVFNTPMFPDFREEPKWQQEAANALVGRGQGCSAELTPVA